MADSVRSRGSRLFTALMSLLFVAMAVEVVLLVRQNRELKRTVAELRAGGAAAEATAPAIAVGERVVPIELRSLAGERVRLGYDEDRETVLLVFSPHCPACQQNMPQWKRLETVPVLRGALYYVSTSGDDETREFRDTYLLNGPVLLADPETLAVYRITHIPTTLIVAPGGVVRRVWVGILPEDALRELGAAESPA